MIEIRTLKNIGIDTIHSSFSKAFSDYEEPFDMTVHQLQYMIECRGFRSELSFGAFDRDDTEVVACYLYKIVIRYSQTGSNKFYLFYFFSRKFLRFFGVIVN